MSKPVPITMRAEECRLAGPDRDAPARTATWKLRAAQSGVTADTACYQRVAKTK